MSKKPGGPGKSRAVNMLKRGMPRVLSLIGLKRAMLSLIDGKGPIRFVLALLAFFRFTAIAPTRAVLDRWRGVNKQTAMKHLLSFKKELGTLTSAINRRSSKQKKRGGKTGIAVMIGLIASVGA
nr:anchored capsid protein C [West Nile virus]